MTLLLVGAVATVTTGVVLAVLRPVLARRALDVPSARSSHARPRPRAGGLGVVTGALAAVAAAYALGEGAVSVVLAALVAMAFVGLVEDLRGLPVMVRLVAQALVAVAVVAVLRQDGLGPMLLLPVVVVALVGYCNAFNFMDGIDGISGFTALVVCGWYAVVGQQLGADPAVLTCVVLAGSMVGFLPWNVPAARLFLGDTGSYALGMALPVLGLHLRTEGATWPAILAPLIVYLADVAWTLVSRVRRGERWHEAHREHIYQRVSLRLGHLSTAALVAGFAAVPCAIWWLLEPSLVATVVCWAVLLAAYLSQLRWCPADR